MAQTSDWAQEEEVKEEGSGFESEGVEETEEGVEASALSDGEESSGDGVLAVGEEEYYPEPPEEAKLYVGNLPYDVDSEKLAHIFNEAGVVEIAEVNLVSLMLCVCFAVKIAALELLSHGIVFSLCNY